MGEWTVEHEDAFERFYLGLPEYKQAVLEAAITHVLAVRGIDVCRGEWGKPLGNGLYEFRVRRSLQAILSEAGEPIPPDLVAADVQVLLRVLCTFHGDRIVLLLCGYDKGTDPSSKRQSREVTKARKLLAEWQARRREGRRNSRRHGR